MGGKINALRGIQIGASSTRVKKEDLEEKNARRETAAQEAHCPEGKKEGANGLAVKVKVGSFLRKKRRAMLGGHAQ